MTFILTLLASVVPGLLICYFIVKQDKYEKEPLPLLAICFGLGIAIFYAARIGEGFMDDLITPFVTENELDPNTHFGVLFYSAFIRTALVEELLKLSILLAIPFNHKQFNEPMDGIVYAVMIGMGFAIIENIIYCLPSEDITLAIVRNFTAVPAHAIFGVILGYYVVFAKFDRTNLFKNIFIGFSLAVVVHGLYDFFLFQRYDDWLMILATFVLMGGLFFSRKFITRHQEDSPFKNQNPIEPIPAETEILEPEIVLEKENKPSDLGHEDNEILSAVLFEMKEKQNAEEIKIKYACALTQLAGADETIKVPSVGERPPRDLSRQALAEVVEPRYDELFTLVQAELRRSGFEDMIAAGVVLTGGTSKMEGVVELAEEIFHMPVRLAKPVGVSGLIDVINNPIYATAVGLLQYAAMQQKDPIKTNSREEVPLDFFSRVKHWIQNNF